MSLVFAFKNVPHHKVDQIISYESLFKNFKRLFDEITPRVVHVCSIHKTAFDGIKWLENAHDIILNDNDIDDTDQQYIATISLHSNDECTKRIFEIEEFKKFLLDDFKEIFDRKTEIYFSVTKDKDRALNFLHTFDVCHFDDP